LAEVVERGDMDLAALEPGEALAVRRDGDLTDGNGTVEAGKDLFELGSGWAGRGSVGVLRGEGQEKRCREKQRQEGTAKPAKRGRHREMLAAGT
jgi:hypothetical protein